MGISNHSKAGCEFKTQDRQRLDAKIY